MMDHTKEPWSMHKRAGQEKWAILADAEEIQPGDAYSEANARRIVACVNACTGIDIELLENVVMLGDTLLDRFKALTEENHKLSQQRDQLIESLEIMSNPGRFACFGDPTVFRGYARTVLDNMKGKA